MKKLCLLLLFFISFIFSLSAQIFYPPPSLVPYLDNPPEITSRAAVLIDAETGTFIFSKNADDVIPPASLTKLMTMHIVMKEIKAGRASFDELIPVTTESWAQSQPPRSSLMFLAPGQTVTLREILLGLAVASGNDAAVAAALRFAPTMKEFGLMMTREAQNMGLYITRFVESSGISGYNRTTAAEFASFSRQYLYKHPESLDMFHSVLSMSYPMSDNVAERYKNNPRTIVQDNRNTLLRTFDGADGLKTGFINESGYNVSLTAERDNTRYIAVILGAPNTRWGSRIRDEDGEKLLTWAFDYFKTVRPVIGNIENVKVWKSKKGTAGLELADSPNFTASIGRAHSLNFETVIPNPIIAPLEAGTLAGYLKISDEHGELYRVPLALKTAIEKGNIFKRFWHSFLLLFNR